MNNYQSGLCFSLLYAYCVKNVLPLPWYDTVYDDVNEEFATTVEVGTEKYTAVGETKKEARYNAVVKALNVIQDRKFARFLLDVYATTNQFPKPSYRTTSTGSQHSLQFQATSRVGNKERTGGVFRKEKEAKISAAYELLKAINFDVPSSSGNCPLPRINDVGSSVPDRPVSHSNNGVPSTSTHIPVLPDSPSNTSPLPSVGSIVPVIHTSNHVAKDVPSTSKHIPDSLSNVDPDILTRMPKLTSEFLTTVLEDSKKIYANFRSPIGFPAPQVKGVKRVTLASIDTVGSNVPDNPPVNNDVPSMSRQIPPNVDPDVPSTSNIPHARMDTVGSRDVPEKAIILTYISTLAQCIADSDRAAALSCLQILAECIVDRLIPKPN